MLSLLFSTLWQGVNLCLLMLSASHISHVAGAGDLKSQPIAIFIAYSLVD